MDEEKPAVEAGNVTADIEKDPLLLTDSKEDLKKIDLLICGQCHGTFYFIEEFKQHKDNNCSNKSTLKEQCENESYSQVWGFTLWKNKQIRDKTTKSDSKTTSAWEMYQEWCNLEQSLRDPWIIAGKTLQFCTTIGDSKVNNIKSEKETVEVKVVDNNRAFRTIKEQKLQEKQEYVVESIVSKRFNPRRKTFEYQIKWENFDSTENTWEPVANLSSCKRMVEEFEEHLRELKAEKLKQQPPKGRGRGRGANSPLKSFLGNLTPGRPVRTSKQKALDQVKQWCGNISEGDESGLKRPYDDGDDSDDSFEKKMKFEDFSDDSDIEFKSENVKKLLTKPILQTQNNGVGRKVPQNVLIPDKNGVVRINQKQLPQLSTGVYIMSKTAGIIKLDSSTSKVATSGGQTIVKVAPKIGQTQIKIVKKDANRPQQQFLQQKVVKQPPVTIIKKVVEEKKPQKDEESDDGLEELEFPTDLPLPGPESPPSEFVLDPTTGKLAGQEYPEKEEEINNTTSLENIVQLAAADITEEDLKTDPEPTVVVVQTTKPQIQQQQIQTSSTNVVTNSMNILQRSLTAAPKPKSTPRILNQARVAPASSTTIHTTPRVLNQSGPIVRTVQTKIVRQPPVTRIIPPRPRFNVTQQQQNQRVYSRQQPTVQRKVVNNVYKTQTQQIQQQQRPQARIVQTNVYKASPRKETVQQQQQQIVQQKQQQQVQQMKDDGKKKAVINMPSLIDEPTKELQEQKQQETNQESKTENQTTNDFSFTLSDNENPIFITGDDGTVYQVAGQNEQGQTILITQDSNGQQQCLLVTNEAVQEDGNNSTNTTTTATTTTTTSTSTNSNESSEASEKTTVEQTVQQSEQQVPVDEPLSVKTDQDASNQVIAQVVRAEPPSPGGTHKVVVMLPNGNLMVTEVTAEEYASLELE